MQNWISVCLEMLVNDLDSHNLLTTQILFSAVMKRNMKIYWTKFFDILALKMTGLRLTQNNFSAPNKTF